jgi:hypothetical protein
LQSRGAAPPGISLATRISGRAFDLFDAFLGRKILRVYAALNECAAHPSIVGFMLVPDCGFTPNVGVLYRVVRDFCGGSLKEI